MTIVLLFITTGVFAEKDKQDNKKWDVNSPPGESYQVNIDVSQGTWMNVDVSPDGQTLLFDLLGDLYTMPIAGGEAKALTHSMAWEMQPTFSPDGKSIAYTSDEGGGDNIWIMKADGTTPEQLTKESFRLLNSPTWSPDGKYIAARKHFTSRRSLGAGEIWLYHIAGGNGLQLNKRPNDQKDLGEPAFSADGKKVFFSRDSTPGKTFEYSKDSNKVIYETFSVDRATGEIEEEISGMGGSVRPTPSPDGKSIAFVRRIRNQSSLFIKDLTTGIETPVYQKLERDMQETWAIHGVYPTMAWTPDSQNLVFWAGGNIHQLNLKNQSTKLIPFHVKATREMRKAVTTKVDPAPEKFNTKLLRWVQVRPDGKQVVFQALGHLYTRKLPLGKPVRLTKAKDEFEFYPSYSEDGRWIVYTTWNDAKQGTVKKVRSSGGRSVQLTRQAGKYISPTFSQDAKQVVYEKITGGYLLSSDHDLVPGIYSVSAKGGESKKITDDGGAPVFDKTTNRIFLKRYNDKKIHFVSVDENGQDEIVHASSKFATDFSLSPNQDYLAFRERYQLYVTPFTAAAKAIELSPKAKNLPLLNVSSDGGQYLSWSRSTKKANKNSGNELNWSLGSKMYRLTLPEPNQWKNLSSKETDKSKDVDKTKKIVLDIQVDDLGFSVKSDIPKGNILLSGAQIITMKGDEVFKQGDVLIEANKIKAVGKKGSLSLPKNTRIIDVNGKTIMPGIIDAHWHGSQGTQQLTPQQNWNNIATLAFGITTIHDPSNNTAEIFSSAELARQGSTLAPRIFSTGTILYGAKASITTEVNSLDDAAKHLRRLNAQGAFSVKSYNQPRRDQRQQVLEAARQTNMMVVPEGGSTFQHNLTMIVDGHTGIEHSIPVAAIYDDVKQLWSQSQTAYTPTLVVAYGGIWGEHYWYQQSEVWKHPLLSQYVPKHILYPRAIRRTMAPTEDYNHFNNAKVTAQLQKLGVGVQLGAHGQREGLGAHWEMWMFAQGGMSPLEVIRAATIDGAKYLGMDKYLGSLEVGKLADLVILDADPLKDIYSTDKVDMVMINGRLYDSKTMNEVGNHPKARNKMYFE